MPRSLRIFFALAVPGLGIMWFLLVPWMRSACFPLLSTRLQVPLAVESFDANGNGLADALDLVAGARSEARRRTIYDASYYAGGYPPAGRGVCTDVIWWAFKRAGLDLKLLVDADIRREPAAYGETGRRPDPAIDFRRVPNLVVFFERQGRSLPITVRPGDLDNLIQWQPGDIVVFAPPYHHIGIVSDCRRRDGVPLLIHNAGPWATEKNVLLTWPTAIVGHFRYPSRDVPS